MPGLRSTTGTSCCRPIADRRLIEAVGGDGREQGTVAERGDVLRIRAHGPGQDFLPERRRPRCSSLRQAPARRRTLLSPGEDRSPTAVSLEMSSPFPGLDVGDALGSRPAWAGVVAVSRPSPARARSARPALSPQLHLRPVGRRVADPVLGGRGHRRLEVAGPLEQLHRLLKSLPLKDGVASLSHRRRPPTIEALT